MSGPKILLLDIETAPHVVYTWGLFNQNVGINQIVESGYTMCFAAKWLNSDEVIYKSLHEDGMEMMLTTMHSLLSNCDVVVHYNGEKFDMPTLNKEFIREGLPPPAPYMQVDLLKVARKQFKFASNKLDYVCQFLGLGEKHHHKGFDLWKECMAGHGPSWKIMKDYNIQDVLIMEKLYLKLLPWIKNHPNFAVYRQDLDEHNCPNCGSVHVQRRGYTHTRTQRYARYRCNECGTWSRQRTTDLGKEHRASVLSAC